MPTWNFVAVHAWGKPVIQDDPAWLRAQLEALTESQEKARVLPWRVADAPADFIAAQMRAIVGVEIPIARIEGKWKASQNRTPADRQGVAQAWRKRRRGHGGTGGAARRTGLRLHIRAWRRLAPAISRDCHAVGCAALRATPRAPGPRPGCLSRPPAAARRRREAQRLLPGLL